MKLKIFDFKGQSSPASASFSRYRVVKKRMENMLTRFGKERCCVLCCKLAANEIETNNQFYNLVKKTAPLSPRPARLAVIYFTVQLELTVCALFFDLGVSFR